MAKNKKKKRTPIAPPVHSAPGTFRQPSAPTSATPPSAPASDIPEVRTAPVAPAPKPRKQTQSSRAAARRRKSKRRNYAIGIGVVLLLLAAIFVPRYLNGRAVATLNALGEDAGCGRVETTGDSGASDHLAEGEVTEYSPLPPSHGAHALSPLPAGVYEELSEDANEELNIYRSVHSLEHGAVVIWHNKLSEDQLTDLTATYRDQEKILVVDYPKLPGRNNKIGLTAWGKSMSCRQVDDDVIDEFIKIYRGARTAPEPNNPI